MITQSRLIELVEYLPDSGFFIWRRARGNMKAGAVAGSLQKSGKRCKGYVYLAIRIDGKEYAAHRLAWLYMTGAMPPPEIHIDQKDNSSLNNRWLNLRTSDHTTNQWNRGAHKDNKLGFKGVDPHRGKFRARISKHGKRELLGLFDTPEAAAEAYKNAAVKMHGAFAYR